MKRAAIYVRVSTVDQHPENQIRDLREYAQRRGLSVAQEQEYVDHGIGGTKARRPALDRMLEDARRRRFDVLVVWSCDRPARSTRHFLQVLDELDSCEVQFVSLREAFDASGALGRAFLGIVAVLGEMERALLIERVRSGMARARAAVVASHSLRALHVEAKLASQRGRRRQQDSHRQRNELEAPFHPTSKDEYRPSSDHNR